MENPDINCPSPQKRQRRESGADSVVQVLDICDWIALEEDITHSVSQIYTGASSCNPTITENRTESRMDCEDSENCTSLRRSQEEMWHASYSHIIHRSDEFNGLQSIDCRNICATDGYQLEGDDYNIGSDPNVQPISDKTLDFSQITREGLRDIGENELADFLESFEPGHQVGMGESENHNAENDRYYSTVKERMATKFTVRETLYVVKLQPRYTNEGWQETLHGLVDCLQEVIDKVTSDLNPQDLVRAYISQTRLQTPLILGLCPVQEFTVNKILALIEMMLQSN